MGRGYKGEGLIGRADFGIDVDNLSWRQKIQLVLGEMAIGYGSEPASDNKNLANHYSKFAKKHGIDPPDDPGLIP